MPLPEYNTSTFVAVLVVALFIVTVIYYALIGRKKGINPIRAHPEEEKIEDEELED